MRKQKTLYSSSQTKEYISGLFTSMDVRSLKVVTKKVHRNWTGMRAYTVIADIR